ncbi:DUF748 domain-containing protein [Silvimonas soli]|uniref:DUF748 domain-containing protein n=1 Tax=Silvimonas soli TaxID=2980100 RepID=UPI0024B38D1B|nr:DUF748 domain-containing protein [Silvimonas soli]
MPRLRAWLVGFIRTPGRLARWLTGLAVLLVLVAIGGFLLLPWLARPQLEKALTQALHRPTTIAAMGFNPFTLQAHIDGLQVREAGKTVLSAKSVVANLDLASIWRRGPVLSALTLDTPYLLLQRQTAHRYNWSDLLDQPASKPKTDNTLPRFALYNIQLLGGRIDFDDQVVKQKTAITGIELGVPFISSLPGFVDTVVEPHLAFKLNGSPFDLHGKTTPFENTRQTTVDLKVTGLDLPQYMQYVPLELGIKLPAAKFDSQLQLVFRQEHDQPQLRLTGSAALRDVQLIDDAGAPLFGVTRLQITLADVRPLAGVYHLQNVESDGLHLAVTRDDAGNLNFIKALQNKPASTAAPAKAAASAAAAKEQPSATPDVAIAQINLRKSRVDLRDETVKPAFVTVFDPLDITVQRFTLPGKTAATLDIAAATPAGEKITQQGTFTLQPLVLDGNIKLAALALPQYQPYATPRLNAAITGGTLDFASQYHYAADTGLKLSAVNSSFNNFQFKLNNSKEGQLQIGKLAIADASLDFDNARYQLGRVTLADANIGAARGLDGLIDWGGITKAQAADAHVGRPVAAAVAELKPPHVAASAVNIDNLGMRFVDHQLPKLPPVVIKSLKLETGPVEWPSATPAQFSLLALGGKGGRYEVSGAVANSPASGKIKLNLQNLDVGYGQAYYSRWLNVTVPSIHVSAKGDLVFGTAPKFTGSYRGSVRVDDLYSLDKITGEDFLKFKRLDVSGIDARFEPLRVNVNTVSLQDFYSRLVLYPDGHLNLADIVVKEGNADRRGKQVSLTSASAPASAAVSATPVPTPAPKPGAVASAPVSAPAKPLPPISIGTIKLAGGNINYTDDFVKPNYTANLTDMGGTITGLSSAETARAALDIKGSVDHIAPVAVSGQLNPLAQQLFLDINASVKGYELAAASTYSAKYAGYGIQKGKLSMDVHYQIENRKLLAQNKVSLDQLTLGDKTDSPDATKLPVKLALSLLTDRNGQINLDLPIAGSLDDPQFSVGGLIIKVIVNLLEKAITAPFDLLASAFGGGPQFSYAAFAPGSAVLDTATQESLSKLTTALNDRPAMKLEISGWADPAVDQTGLRKEMVLSRMKAIKAKQLVEHGESVADETALEITPEEYPKLLEVVYKQAKFPNKPTNLIGMNKSLPPAEMEKLLLANLPAGENELRALANQRALVVKSFLESKGVDVARVYVTQPRIDAGGGAAAKDGGPTTRAAFKLG